jgi:uncharacterized membrane protein YbhN (UPF0104 family)
VVLLVVVALPIAGIPPALRPVVEAAAWWIGGLAALGLATLALVLWLRPHEKLARGLDRVIEALNDRRGAVVGAACLSVAVQSTFVLTNVWLAREVGVTTGLAAWFVAWPLSKLIAILPISLGGIGVREAALVALLTPFGAPREAVLASGILWQAVLAASGIIGLVITQSLQRTTSAAPIPTPPKNS